MAQLVNLFNQMKEPVDMRMHAEGYAVWMVWQGDLNPVVQQAMQDYGGLPMGEDSGQSLLFFFSTDVFLAAARLETWARFNSLAVSLAVMPASLTMGDARVLSLHVAPDLRTQELGVPESFQVWIHPDCAQAATSIPGLKCEDAPLPQGMSGGAWRLLRADTRLPYQASLGGYAVLRPLGSPLDKSFQSGWRMLFEEVEKILQRHKFRYTIHDFFLMFPLENLRLMKAWTHDYLTLIARLKEEKPDSYWPCAMVLVDRKNLSFNNDLPKKIHVDWDQLAADNPYMSFRNGLLLGAQFAPHEVRFASGTGPDDWCNVSLPESAQQSGASIPLLAPAHLILGDKPLCFYCGQRSHEAIHCPTRNFSGRDKDIWRRLAGFDFAAMKDGVQALDEEVAKNGLVTLPDLVQQDSPTGVMARALFEIDLPLQLRSVSRFWRAKGKLPPASDHDLTPEDNNPIWDMWANFADADKSALEKSLQALALRFPRDYRVRTAQGYVALERGDGNKAAAFWKEAESMAPAGFSQAWHAVLQARVLECSGRLGQAIILYEQAARQCPQWTVPLYRKIVCQVKTGFADKALLALATLLEQDANYFNMAILDPELERGQIQILTGLGTLWAVTDGRMQDEPAMLAHLRKEIGNWLTPDHPFATQADDRIRRLQDMAKYRNYVPFIAAIHGRQTLERDMQQLITRESRDFRNRFKGYLEKLAVIRDEAAWFPFPRIMVEFNKNYNQCAASLNWAMQTNLGVADAFRRAQLIAVAEEERIAKLERRLKLLRMIRDVTLFGLTLLRTFFWLEVIGLLLVLVALPLLLFYAQKSGSNWAVSAMIGQQWQVQKAATFIVSFLAFAFALLRTVMRFEKIRDALLEKARSADRERAAERRRKAAKQKPDE